LTHEDRFGQTPNWLGEGLRRSMLNFLEGRGLTLDVRQWFDCPAPKPQVASNWLKRLLKNRHQKDDPQIERRFVWLGNAPAYTGSGKRRRFMLPGKTSAPSFTLKETEAQWLADLIEQSSPRLNRSAPYPLIRQAAATFPGSQKEFATFMASPAWSRIRSAGLLLV
ncbi:MAG TPA: hypothetical protein VLD60_02080, partial [Nitrospira sp.]|nr:hypothetical protein [Nitrospira sp.]